LFYACSLCALHCPAHGAAFTIHKLDRAEPSDDAYSSGIQHGTGGTSSDYCTTLIPESLQRRSTQCLSSQPSPAAAEEPHLKCPSGHVLPRAVPDPSKRSEHPELCYVAGDTAPTTPSLTCVRFPPSRRFACVPTSAVSGASYSSSTPPCTGRTSAECCTTLLLTLNSQVWRSAGPSLP
jgi:hypothetical protein